VGDIEKTLILFKPDALQRGFVGEILTRFERVGLKLVGTKMVRPDRDNCRRADCGARGIVLGPTTSRPRRVTRSTAQRAARRSP